MVSIHTDYTDTFTRLRKIERVMDAAITLGVVVSPLAGAAQLAGWDRLHRLASGIDKICEMNRSAMYLTRRLLGYGCGDSHLVQHLAKSAPRVATTMCGDTAYYWHDLFGCPVLIGSNPSSDWYSAPETAAQIYARMRDTGSCWRFAQTPHGSEISPDTDEIPAERSAQTSEIIARTRRFRKCRALLLTGPPGGGKSVAAAQIMEALADMRVTLSPAAAGSPEVWECLDVLQPQGILIDDLDSVTDTDALLSRLVRVRSYARVIVSTANVSEEMRGALTRCGRAADDDPIVYGALDPATAVAIAPCAAFCEGADQLLAAYLAEAEERIAAGFAPDIEGLVERMSTAGDR